MKKFKHYKRRITKLNWIMYCVKLLTKGINESIKYIDKDKIYDI